MKDQVAIDKEKAILAKMEKANLLAAKEKKAVFDKAKIKGDKIKEQAAVAILKKQKTEIFCLSTT